MTMSTEFKVSIVTLVGILVSGVWGAANLKRDVADNEAAVESLSKKSRRMAIGIRRNRSDIQHMILMQKAVLRKMRIPLPPEPEPDILEYDDEVKDAGN